MKSTTFASIAFGALVIGSGLFSSDANAIDRKVYHPMACVPLSPLTTFADLSYRPVSVKNISGDFEYVVCPLSVDADDVSYWTATGGKTGVIFVTFQAPVAGTATCEVSIGSNLDGTKSTFTGSYTFAAGEVGNVTISNINGDAVTTNFMATYPVSLYCKMPTQSSILRLNLQENAVDTDDPAL